MGERTPSLTHRLNLSGVKVPTPEGKSTPNNGGARRQPKAQKPAQKPRNAGNKSSEPGTQNPSSCTKERDMSDQNTQTQSNTQTQAQAVAEGVVGAFKGFKGLDVKIRVQEKGIDWGEVGELGLKVGIGVLGAAAVTAAGLGVARLYGYKPGKPAPTP